MVVPGQGRQLRREAGAVRSFSQELLFGIVRPIDIGLEKLRSAEQVFRIGPSGDEVAKPQQKSRYDLYFLPLWRGVHSGDRDGLQLDEPS